MRKFLDEIENAAVKAADTAKDACDKALPSVEKGIDQAVQSAKAIYAKADDHIERLVSDVQNAYQRAAENLREGLRKETCCEEPPKPQTLDDELNAGIDAQVSKIREAQKTPGIFSDYIAKKYGKDKK